MISSSAAAMASSSIFLVTVFLWLRIIVTSSGLSFPLLTINAEFGDYLFFWVCSLCKVSWDPFPVEAGQGEAKAVISLPPCSVGSNTGSKNLM